MGYTKWLVRASLIVMLLLCVIFSLLNRVELTLQPASLVLNPPSVILIQDGQLQKLAISRENKIAYSLAAFWPSKILSESALPSTRLNISQVSVSSIFGSPVLNFHPQKGTDLSELLKLSSWCNVSVNSQLNRSSTLLSKLGTVFFAALKLTLLFWAFLSIALLCLKGYVIPILEEYSDQDFAMKYLSVVNCVCLGVVVAMTIWACCSGILFPDDGFFNLMSKYPQDVLVTGTPTLYYRFTHLLFILMQENVIGFRISSVLLNLSATLLLTFAFLRMLSSNFNVKPTKHYGWLLFSLLYISGGFVFIHHTAPDYSILSKFILYVQVSLLMLLFARSGSQLFLPNLGLFVFGFVTGINLFIKFPEAIASILLCIFIFRLMFRKYFKAIMLVLFGCMVAVSLYFMFIQSLSASLLEFKTTLYFAHILGGHQVSELLWSNFRDISSAIGKILALLVVYHYMTKSIRLRIKRETIIIITVTLIFVVTIGRSFPIRYPTVTHYLMPLVFSVLLTIGLLLYENIRSYAEYDLQQRIKFKRTNLVCFILLVFTYLGSVGTDIDILYHVIFQGALLYLIIVLQWLVIDNRQRYRYLFYTLLSLMTSLIFIKGIIYNSYMYQNLLQQTNRYSLTNGSIYLDLETTEELNLVKTKLQRCGYRDGDFLAGYYGMPGLIFALGGRASVNPWYAVGYDESSTLRANRYLNSLRDQHTESNLFLLYNSKSSYGESALDLNLNRDYIDCGAVDLTHLHQFDIEILSIYRRR